MAFEESVVVVVVVKGLERIGGHLVEREVVGVVVVVVGSL